MKTSKLHTLIGIGVLSLTMSAFGDSKCAKVTAPTMPDPNTASVEDMIAARAAVQLFLKDTEGYLNCVRSGRRYGKAIAKMNDIAETYNRNLRVFKSRMADDGIDGPMVAFTEL